MVSSSNPMFRTLAQKREMAEGVLVIDRWETPDKKSPLAPVATRTLIDPSTTLRFVPVCLCSFCISCTCLVGHWSLIKLTGSTCFCKISRRTAEAYKAPLSFDRILSLPHVCQHTSLHLLLRTTLSFSSPHTGANRPQSQAHVWSCARLITIWAALIK